MCMYSSCSSQTVGAVGCQYVCVCLTTDGKSLMLLNKCASARINNKQTNAHTSSVLKRQKATI